ncbi:MAG TPA: DUF72 domain-containing protein [Vicinamibacterales bacterium]|nr:DUF72 domain-containing protein [Vicinamibacterales bacterium]
MLLNPNIRIGCSGWQYTHWRGDFYPAELPASAWLDFYARHFDTVEINNTFYRLPDASTFASWGRRAPRGFVYAVKASRYLTHMKKLKDPRDPIRLFFTRAKRLARTFGPVLYQLPPHWPVNIERLATFLKALPRTRRHALEFREPSWYCDQVFALLERHRVSLCLHDLAGSESGRRAVGPFVYVRFHGRKYAGSYSDRTIGDWADWLVERAREGRAIYAYFNNDAGGHAPRDAVRLRAALASRLGREGQERREGQEGQERQEGRKRSERREKGGRRDASA